MTKPSSNRFSIAVAISVALAGVVNSARAALNYWDPGGATVLATSTETWEHSKWAPTSTPTASTTAWTEGVAAAFSASAGNATNATYNVIANANHTIAGIFNGDISDMVSTNLQITGTGILTISAATGGQGFDTRGSGNTTIYNVLAGPGGPQTQGSGSLFLFGTNTFTGGLYINTGAGLNFNNGSSFGTGLITNMTVGSVLATPVNDGGGNATGATNAITIANAMWAYNNTAAANDSSITIVGNGNAPITWTGAWHLNAPNTNTLTLDTRSGTLTISGVVSGAENITKKTTTGTLVLSGANTFSGKVTLGGPVSVGSLNKVSGGSANSNLGHPTTVANGTIAIGITTTAGTLIYTGAGETTDRVIDLSGTTGGATIQADGTGNLTFTAVNTATGAGAKTLTLTGSGATTNSIGKIIDSTGATSLSKAGTTTWTLATANTYSGTTSVTAGKLQLANAASLGTNTLTWSSGSIDNITGSDLTLANNITVGGNPTYVGSANNLTFTGTATLTGNRTISVTANTLTLSSIAENAASKNLAKSGNGTLIVTSGLTHTGTTTVSAGTLKLSGASQLAANNFGNYSNTLAVTGTFDYSSSAAQTLMGSITGGGSILVNGSGSLIWAGTNAPTFSGTVTVNSGTLVAGLANCFPANGTIALNGGTIDMGANNATVKALNYGVISKPAGTYGAIGSAAQHQSAQFSGTGILTVTTGATSTTVVTSDVQSTTPGQPVTFTVTVTGNGGDGTTPTGTATLYDNGVSIATITLSGSGNVASGTFATSSLTVGDHPMTATWNGNDSYGASTSAVYDEYIVQPPVITSPTTASTIVANAGTNVVLAVTLQDSNGASYVWRRGFVTVIDNGAYDNAATVAGATTGSLTLLGVKAADASQGNYTCVVQNAAGSATSAAFTLVVNDPAISVQPTNSTFECGSNGCLSVTAAGTTNANGVLLYQWLAGSSPIAAATNSSLCFSPAHFTDAGSYSVIVSNALGNSVTSQVAVVMVQDTTGPVVTLNGAAEVTVECHGSFSDPGATATDACQGAATIASATGGSVNLNAVGDYTLSYTASDSFSNPGNVATRVVHVRDTTAPTVTLTGTSPMNVECHASFTDPGATASDVCDASPSVSASGTVNANVAGTYTLTYTATDASGNQATATRQVVVSDTTAPVVTLNGASSVTVECHGSFSDPGATGADACAGNLSTTQSGTVNLNTVGSYTRTYTATDPSGNSGTATRVITVGDTGGPSLIGVPADTTAECDSIPTAASVTATDSCDANPGVNLVETTVAGSCAQSYTLVRTWTATDASGNSATAAQHITVQDTTAPVVTLVGNASMNVECHTSFVDPGATANDACAGSLSATRSGSVDTNTLGDYTMTYSATDPCGNTGTVTRVVHVVDTTAPTVTVTGPNPDTVCAFTTYNDPGATASDSCSGSLSTSATGTVDTSTLGDYTLTYVATDASSNSGSATRVVHVVGCGATITQQPQSQNINAGTTLNVTVVAVGDSMTYQWSKDGTEIGGATNSTYSAMNVTRADAGSYTCAVTAGTTAVSDAAVITVQDPAINGQPANVVAATTSNVTFTVSAAGTGPLTYRWLKNGAPITKDTATVKGTATPSLTLLKVATSGSGTAYSCLVSNGPLTTATSDAATLSVFDAPTVTVAPPSHTLYAGQTYTLKATVHKGKVNQGYQWYKDGVLLPGATASTYTIMAPQPDAAGTYSVVITNNSPVSATNSSVIAVTPDTAPPHTILIMSPKSPSITKAAWVAGTPIADAAVTNLAPQIEVLAKFVDPHGLLVGGYFTNQSLNSLQAFPGAFCVSKTDLTGTNATYSKPAYFHGTVTLVDGTNLIQAVAQDYGTNSAGSKIASYYYMGNPSTCTMTNNGTGKISAKVLDRIWGLPSLATITTAPTLEVGHTYTLKGQAVGRNVHFVQWDVSDPSAIVSTATLSATSATLTFTMKANLVISAKYTNGQ